MNNMIGIDLFSGAGGMALGARQAGINIKIAVEIDKYASMTYQHNHPGVKVITSDITKLDKDHLPNGNHDKVLLGGPPCQGFSTSNQRNRNSNNPFNWLFYGFFRIADIWRPNWIVFENVKGMIETENGFFFNKILKQFKKLGYTTSYWILNAADYGVPQIRYRLFIVGFLKDKKIKKPEPLVQRHITIGEAIEDLPELPNGASTNIMLYKSKKSSEYAKKMRGDLVESANHLVTKNAEYVVERYKFIPQGGNWANIPAKLMGNYKDRFKCHTGIYRRLDYSCPSVVIGNFRKNMLIHPTQDRGLSVREAARLQSFPDWFEFKGSIGFQQQQVGNAVPPLMAKAVFSQLLNAG